MSTFPFYLPGIFGQLAQLEGIVRLEDDALVLEFRIADTVIQIWKSRPRELRIPLAEIEEVNLRTGYFKNVLSIRVRRMAMLASVPGADNGELNLRCKRRHVPAARELDSALKGRLLSAQISQSLKQLSAS